MDLIKTYASSSPEPASPPEALREPPRPLECPDLELSLISSESAVSERKAAAFGSAPPAACSTPDAGLEASIGGNSDESGRKLNRHLGFRNKLWDTLGTTSALVHYKLKLQS